MSNEKTSPPQMPEKKGINYRRSEAFFQSYANNVYLLTSNWDLKLIFGELDQMQSPNLVVQNGSVTLPWAQVKVLAYFLSLQLTAHEAEFGRLVIPSSIIPEIPAQRPKGFENVPEETWQQLRKLYATFLAENPEALP